MSDLSSYFGIETDAAPVPGRRSLPPCLPNEPIMAAQLQSSTTQNASVPKSTSAMTSELYLISARTLDGTNMSAVVRAKTPREAFNLYVVKLVDGEDLADPDIYFPDLCGFERPEVEVSHLVDGGKIGILDRKKVTWFKPNVKGVLRQLGLT
jgi:hypothetical protein